ncbi:hypothetical protein D3C80_2029950 [compost metagenome]
MQLVILVASREVVDFVAHHRHGPVEASILGQIQSQALGMAPGAAFQPGDIHRVVGVAEAVDVFTAHTQIDDEWCCQIPAHARSHNQ